MKAIRLSEVLVIAGLTVGWSVTTASGGLLVNPGAETGDMSGWIIDLEGGVGWSANIENLSHSGTHAFVASYGWDARHQVIDLLAAGYSAAQLDAAPSITIGEWVATRSDCGGYLFMDFQLLDKDQNPLNGGKWGLGTIDNPIYLPPGVPYLDLSCTFSGYGAGLRYIYFGDGGHDENYWDHNYGTHFDDAYVFIPMRGEYTYTTLDDPLGMRNTYAFGISGTNIVGYYYDVTNGFYRGFLYNGSTWTTLDAPLGAGGTFPYGVSGGNIVGYYEDTNGLIHGFLYSAPFWITLDAPQGVGYTCAYGISGANIVGCYGDTNGYTHGFLYNGSTWTTLDAPLGADGTYASGISGTNIVGWYYDENYASHGFLYNGSTWTTLDAPRAVGNTCASAISGTNIGGYYTDNKGNNRGFTYNGRIWLDVDDPLSVGDTYAWGMSGANIVGYFPDANGVHGFLAVPLGPQLAITRSGNTLRISWPSPSTGWTLQQNPGLSPANWTPSGGISNDGTNNFITITQPTGNLLFRLKSQ